MELAYERGEGGGFGLLVRGLGRVAVRDFVKSFEVTVRWDVARARCCSFLLVVVAVEVMVVGGLDRVMRMNGGIVSCGVVYVE